MKIKIIFVCMYGFAIHFTIRWHCLLLFSLVFRHWGQLPLHQAQIGGRLCRENHWCKPLTVLLWPGSPVLPMCSPILLAGSLRMHWLGDTACRQPQYCVVFVDVVSIVLQVLFLLYYWFFLLCSCLFFFFKLLVVQLSLCVTQCINHLVTALLAFMYPGQE